SSAVRVPGFHRACERLQILARCLDERDPAGGPVSGGDSLHSVLGRAAKCGDFATKSHTDASSRFIFRLDRLPACTYLARMYLTRSSKSSSASFVTTELRGSETERHQSPAAGGK